MKLNIKKLSLYSLICLSGMGLSSCEDFLDRQPITAVTPEAYFTTADQVANYVNNYYNSYLVNSQGQSLFHSQGWNSGIANNDANTDNLVEGEGNLNYFAGQWQSSSGQNLLSDYGIIRVWNYFLNTVVPKAEAGEIQDTDGNLNQYIGEGYFFRAMAYYNALVKFGDLPIITEVLPNEESYLQEKSVRAPRNEVARFILSDLDEAISRLNDAGFMNNQRINKQAAQLFKSRVALFEATFEKYHKGTGRVPGDANWPGGNFDGNIDEEIRFFLQEAMNAASAVADFGLSLTENTHVINPSYAQIYGWNPYFEMFSQPSLSSVPEVLLWKEYNKTISISHDAPNRLKVGDNDGLTRSLINSFLMADGLPIYASPDYKGDESIDNLMEGRDERLKLFVWSESTVLKTDPSEAAIGESGEVAYFEKPLIDNSAVQNLDRTGYRQRKHYTYDYTQSVGDDLLGSNACPIFRVAEAYLNYIEASYELNGSGLDAKADQYWRALRRRAGVDEDYRKTINATDMNKEIEYQDLGAWSGDGLVDATLFNIRRERRCEFIGEGMRWDDLKRWRSWDRLFVQPFIPEGINLWASAYQNYIDEETGQTTLISDGTTNANVSSESISTYLRPYQRFEANNDLYDGYTWRKAYYLTPIGIQELTLAPSMYQNPYWSATNAGLALE